MSKKTKSYNLSKQVYEFIERKSKEQSRSASAFLDFYFQEIIEKEMFHVKHSGSQNVKG